MLTKLTTALFLAGAMAVPAASYATGTTSTHAGASNTQADTSAQRSAASSDTGRATSDMRSATDRTKSTLSDATITTKVKSKFAADRDVSALKINVDTDNGVVKLSGTAKSQDEAMKATEIARNTEGVKSVDNAIRISSSDTKSSGTRY